MAMRLLLAKVLGILNTNFCVVFLTEYRPIQIVLIPYQIKMAIVIYIILQIM